MDLDFQNVFAILATFECLSIWKFDEYSGRNLVITPESPKDKVPFPKPPLPVDEIKGEEINVGNLLKISMQIIIRKTRHWIACILPMSIKRICRVFLFDIVRFSIWAYACLTFILKWTVVLTVPMLSLSYLFQVGCTDCKFMYPSIVAWFVAIKIALLVICRLVLANLLIRFTEVPGGKGRQDEDSAITK